MAQVNLSTSRTTQADPAAAAEELVSRLEGETPRLVTLFHSRDRDATALNRALRERLPKGTRLIGATTGGEIDRDGLHSGSVVLGALSGDFEVGIGLGAGLERDAFGAGRQAIDRASRELGVTPDALDTRKHVGLVIDDAFRFKKEELLLGILDQNQALMLAGGGASDTEPDPAKQSALLHVDGEVCTDAALVVVFQTDAPWAAMRSHWYLPTGQSLRITRTDATCTRVIEIDGQPAAKRYAELLGVSIDELEFGKPNGFSHRPTALKVGREYFMRAPWKVMPDGSILFANLLQEGSELEIMQLGDMAGITRRFFEEDVPARVKDPTAQLLFHCSGRMWTAHGAGKVEELSDAFKAARSSVGFNCHFEIYSGFHINTTLTALVFGSNE